MQTAHSQGDTVTLIVEGMSYVAFQHNQAISIMLMAAPRDQHQLNENTFSVLALGRSVPTRAAERYFDQEVPC